MDVIYFISKVPGFPDAEVTRPDVEWQSGSKFCACGPRLHEYLLAMGKLLKEYNAFSVGEMPCVDDLKEILNAVGYERGELNMMFHFKISRLGDLETWRLGDLETLNAWNDLMKYYADDKEFQCITPPEINLKFRDNARTLMQWSNTPYAGFSTSKQWQKENETYHTINAEAQVGSKDSVFEYWASLLHLKKSHKDIFIYGNFEMVDVKNDDVFEVQKALVVANFKKTEVEWHIQQGITLKKDGVLITNLERLTLADRS